MEARITSVILAGATLAGAYVQSKGYVSGVTKSIPIISGAGDVALGALIAIASFYVNKGEISDIGIAFGVGYGVSALLA